MLANNQEPLNCEDSYPHFVEAQIRRVASHFEVPYEMLTCDYEFSVSELAYLKMNIVRGQVE